jgi:hypothetical protein
VQIIFLVWCRRFRITDQIENEEQLLGLKGDEENEQSKEQKELDKSEAETETEMEMEMENEFDGEMFDVPDKKTITTTKATTAKKSSTVRWAMGAIQMSKSLMRTCGTRMKTRKSKTSKSRRNSKKTVKYQEKLCRTN